jgi:hypothetical protein
LIDFADGQEKENSEEACQGKNNQPPSRESEEVGLKEKVGLGEENVFCEGK